MFQHINDTVLTAHRKIGSANTDDVGEGAYVEVHNPGDVRNCNGMKVMGK